MDRKSEPQKPQHDALTKEELNEVQRNLSMLSLGGVQRFYRETHAACAVECKPTARAMQQLVAAWKVLRRWKWR